MNPTLMRMKAAVVATQRNLLPDPLPPATCIVKVELVEESLLFVGPKTWILKAVCYEDINK